MRYAVVWCAVQNCAEDELVKHALKALSGCVTGDKELDAQGATIAIVGKVSRYSREYSLCLYGGLYILMYCQKQQNSLSLRA